MTEEDPSRAPPEPTPVGLQFLAGMTAGIVVVIAALVGQTMESLYAAGAIAVLLAPYLWVQLGWHGYTAGLLFVAAVIVLALGSCAAMWRGSWDTVVGTVLAIVVPMLVAIVGILVYGGKRGG